MPQHLPENTQKRQWLTVLTVKTVKYRLPHA
jgi:hypothetical protein